jgi:uncharacterized protein YacL
MGWLILSRVLVVALLAHAGYVYTPFPDRPWAGLALGVIAAIVLIFLELSLRAVPGHHMVGALIGGVLGLGGARLIWGALSGLDIVGQDFVHMVLVVLFGYMGLTIGGQKGEWFEPARLVAVFRDASRLHLYKVLDTSVIIDGRIADICETGFLEGTLVVPQFVLRELQQVADSSDSLKRNRGRRGLDILAKVQKMSQVHVQIVETDFPEIREVDLKLIELARRLNGKIVTNDFNLNKVAQLRGVPVLNINELANSLKPVVLPGETLRVFILKEGKEAGQGVAYLDDGTMVVVDQAKRALGKTIEVCVTSVLQTTAGKMIFCRWLDMPLGDSSDTGRHAVVRQAAMRNGRPERRDERWASGLTPPMGTPALTAAVPAPSAPVPSAEAVEGGTRSSELSPSAVPATEAPAAKAE